MRPLTGVSAHVCREANGSPKVRHDHPDSGREFCNVCGYWHKKSLDSTTRVVR